MTETIRTIEHLRKRLGEPRRLRETIGLVPTMGALHAGHVALMDRARAENGMVAATLFVNPTQFNEAGDLDAYPRTFEADLQVCREAGVDVLFAPDEREVYPRELRTAVEVSGLDAGLCGAHRPGHFRGVATVVAKLLLMAQPDRAYFGEKDFQQLAIIRRMVADLNFPVEIVGVETVREPDGLALSSRNRLLTAGQRKSAPAIYEGLRAAAMLAAGGETDAAALRAAAVARIECEPELELEYVEIADAESLESLERLAGEARIAAAVRAGSVRLIDNLALEFAPQ